VATPGAVGVANHPNANAVSASALTTLPRARILARVATDPGPERARHWVGRALLATWTLFLWLGPEPRPLGAPEWVVAALQGSTSLAEPAARLVATLALRLSGLALLGALLMQVLGGKTWDRRSLGALLLAPLLAVGVLWANLGCFPIAPQVELASVSAAAGAVARLALRRRPWTAAGLLVALAALFAWGIATGIHDDLANAVRAVGRHLVGRAREVPDGDAGHARLVEFAFRYAEDNSQGVDPVLANRAAILALAVILGGEQVATVAKRELDPRGLPEHAALRERITLQQRQDWSRHFWVSAGLCVLAGERRSIAVGLSKELMDATPGGTGFSFADLAADAAGNRFTHAATHDAPAARALQARVRAGVRLADFAPELRDLPEGLTRDELQARFGGLGGEPTRRLVDEIERRLAACPGLQ
jgi:hypothetical protein